MHVAARLISVSPGFGIGWQKQEAFMLREWMFAAAILTLPTYALAQVRGGVQSGEPRSGVQSGEPRSGVQSGEPRAGAQGAGGACGRRRGGCHGARIHPGCSGYSGWCYQTWTVRCASHVASIKPQCGHRWHGANLELLNEASLVEARRRRYDSRDERDGPLETDECLFQHGSSFRVGRAVSSPLSHR